MLYKYSLKAPLIFSLCEDSKTTSWKFEISPMNEKVSLFSKHTQNTSLNFFTPFFPLTWPGPHFSPTPEK